MAKPLELANFLEEVMKANPSIQGSKLRAGALKHKIGPSSTLDDPFMAAGIDEIPFEGGSEKVRRYQISQSFPFPGKLSARSDIAEKIALRAEADAETLIRQMRVMATQTFLKATYNLKSIQLNERIQKIIEETTASAKARYRTGDPTHHEWLSAKLELSVLNIELLRLKRLQITLQALLNELRNVPPEAEIELSLDEAKLVEALSVATEISLNKQPELESSKFQNKAAVSELKLVKLSYAPDFVVQGMAMEPTMNDPELNERSNWGVMVGITVPLFFWRKQSELVAAAEKDRLASLAEYQGLKNRLNTELTDAKQQLRTSLDVVKLYKNDVIPLTEMAVKNARSGYTAKTLPLGQLLEALRARRTQDLELLAAQYDVIVAQTRIKELLSTPPVTRFAPARPTVFRGGMDQMGGAAGLDTSATINMGAGMSGPTRKGPPATGESSSGGMGGM